MTKKTRAVRLISRVMAAIMAFSACQQSLLVSAFADSGLKLTPKFHENATVEVSGSKITVTDTNFNDDVWNSKALIDTGVSLVPGKQYKVEYGLSGKEGVGEFFLCKTESMDARYDDTFCTDSGKRCTTFTAIGDKLFIGMQVGNVGMDNSVTAEVYSIGELEVSDTPELMKTANCDVTVDGMTVTAVDTAKNNDVWDSKVLFDAGVALIPGKSYEMTVELTGENGVGEFFLCNSQDLNNRVDRTFFNTPGSKHFIFTAGSDRLLVGMQFGNIGSGNSVSVSINNVKPFHIEPHHPRALYNVTQEDGVITINATDNGENDGEIWNSKVLYPIPYALEPGKEYEVTIELSGEFDKGQVEVFLNKNASLDWDKHYYRTDAPANQDWQIFMDETGKLTMPFKAEGTTAYLGLQFGTLGYGKSFTVKISEPAAYETGVKEIVGGTYVASSSNDNIAKITATDTNEDSGVWTSKLVYFLGNLLEAGKKYIAKVVTKGYGELFLLKGNSIDEKYNGVWKNNLGEAWQTWTSDVFFTAEGEKLYAGMQFGNDALAEQTTGNKFEVEIVNIQEADGIMENRFLLDGTYIDCYTEHTADSFKVYDDNDENNADGFSSKAKFFTGVKLEEGVNYTLTFTLEGCSKEGSCVFFTNGDGDRYGITDWPGAAWFGVDGTHTVHIQGDGSVVYLNAECGTLGKGSGMTISNFQLYATPAATRLTAFSLFEEEVEEVEEEVVEEEVEEVEEEVEEVVEVEETVETGNEPVTKPVEEDEKPSETTEDTDVEVDVKKPSDTPEDTDEEISK